MSPFLSPLCPFVALANHGSGGRSIYVRSDPLPYRVYKRNQQVADALALVLGYALVATACIGALILIFKIVRAVCNKRNQLANKLKAS